MENKELLKENIQKILNEYSAYDAKAWNISIDFYETWSRICKNLKIFKDTKIDDLPTTLVVKKIPTSSPNTQDKYMWMLNDINITPVSGGKDKASENAMRQYLQEGSSLSLISYSKGDKWRDNNTFFINPKIWGLIDNYEFLLETILLVLIKSVRSTIYFERNLGYSLFLSIVDHYDSSLFDSLNHIVKPSKSSKKIGNFEGGNISDAKTIEFIKHIKGLKTKTWPEAKNTYVTSAKKILSIHSFDKLLNLMIENVENNNNIFDYFSTDRINPKINKEISKLEKELCKYRSEFRNNIIGRNKPINLEEGGNSTYTDLENSELNKTKLILLEACHIYDIWRIDEEAKKAKNNNIDKKKIIDILKQAKDVNNGILLNPTCHVMFDRQIIWFRTDGYICYRKEHENDVVKYFGGKPETIRIKPSIFTDKMKHYLIKRLG